MINTKVLVMFWASMVVLSAVLASGQDFRNPLAVQPLDQQMHFYQEAVRENPKNVDAINRLAFAYIQKVRATADQSFNVKAEELLQISLKVDRRNYDSLVYLALIQMSQHRFSDAKATASKAVALRPSDSTAYGVQGDAAYELGLYDESGRAYQKMMDLRPSTSSYSRAAYFRRITGDLSGAVSFMKQALELVDVRDTENQAWCLLQLGNYAFTLGKLEDAETLYSYSLKIFPNYYNSLAGLAKVKAAKGERSSAMALYEKAIAIVPMPDFVAALGDLYLLGGDQEKAQKQYELVEYIGLISRINQEIYNRQLAMFYADHDRNPAEAVRLTLHELSQRKDVYGYDAAAWCLLKNGRVHQALSLIKKALHAGTQDSLIFFHAGMIFEKNGLKPEARKYFEEALALNPHFHPIFSETARKEIAQLKKGTS